MGNEASVKLKHHQNGGDVGSVQMMSQIGIKEHEGRS